MIAILAAISAIPTVPGVVFSSMPNRVFVIARPTAMTLGWKLTHDPVTGLTELDGKPIPVDQPKLFDGALLLDASALPPGRVKVEVGKPRVIVDLQDQYLIAWQGAIVVMFAKISSGRQAKDTPPGSYVSGKKELMHVSSIYGSKMPFSVHLKGNYFIHGSEQTQSGPGSHGCIRLPMYNDAAKWFFDWVAPGTPVKVHGKRPKHRTK